LSAYLATFVVFFSRNGLLNAGLPVLGADKLGPDKQWWRGTPVNPYPVLVSILKK